MHLLEKKEIKKSSGKRAQLNFSLVDRVTYSHLFRHCRLEGKLQFQFSIPWRSWDRIPIETWRLALWIATRKKGSARPKSFCAGLYRERRLSAAELAKRLRALDQLAATSRSARYRK